ncbi:Uncharacterised protein [uncultured archaeon]|nr:Uncharacterised protein [uncultured archaeon]
MKLKPLSPDFETKMISKLSKKISRDFAYKIVDTKARGEIDSIIVLGDGDVDDYTIPIVCHHLNSKKIVGITKPEGKKHRNATLSEFPTYISKLKINKLALVMDQEDQELEEIFQLIESGLKNQHIMIKKNTSSDQFKHYQCEFINKRFDFILIISGLPDVKTNAHKIEDHLVKAGAKLSKISNPNRQDSKETWNSSFEVPVQNEILKKLVNDKSLSCEIFPQHFDGLRLLED